MSILGLCPETSFLSHFCETPFIWGGKQNTHARALQKVWGSLTWWWHLLLLHCLTIILSLSLVLLFFCLFLRTSLLTSFLTSSHLSLMWIRIRWLVISASFLQPSRESFTTSPSPFLILLTSPLWVPSAPVLFSRVRPSSDRSGHKWRRPILQLLLFLLP